MRRHWLAFILSLAVSAAAAKGQSAFDSKKSELSPAVSSEKVRFAVGQMGQGEEFTPASGRPGSWPAVVVLPDCSGLNDTIRNQAKLIAAQGYLVLAVDLYDGRTPSSVEEANRWMSLLPEPDAVRQIEGAVSFLQNWLVNPDRIGIVAWGSGGTYALRVAAHEQRLKAVVVNYGPFSEDQFLLSSIRSPVLINVGALDTSTSTEKISILVESLKIPRSKKDVKIYPDAGHSYEDLSDSEYKQADAVDSHDRTLSFLAKWVRGR